MAITYWQEINSNLQPHIDPVLNKTVLDLFAGCGGLSLGFEANGFKTIGYEMDECAVATYNRNLLGKCVQETLTVDSVYPKADIIIGGPPCQPFSVGGKQLGLQEMDFQSSWQQSNSLSREWFFLKMFVEFFIK